MGPEVGKERRVAPGERTTPRAWICQAWWPSLSPWETLPSGVSTGPAGSRDVPRSLRQQPPVAGHQRPACTIKPRLVNVSFVIRSCEHRRTLAGNFVELCTLSGGFIGL